MYQNPEGNSLVTKYFVKYGGFPVPGKKNINFTALENGRNRVAAQDLRKMSDTDVIYKVRSSIFH